MISGLFSFRDTIGRLSFIGWTLAGLVPPLLLALVLGVPGGAGQLAGRDDATGLLLLMIPMAFLSVWSTLALNVKRIRDIGLSPALVLGCVTILALVDRLLIAGLTKARFVEPLEQATPIGGALFITYTAMLLLWPGSGSAVPAKPAGSPVSRLSGFVERSAQEAPVARSAPSRGPARPGGFGRRTA